ncbi:universal stress protein [Mycolicibacterium lacusdiani]|uniref:universal stress protein n=1 Tax=Mycolicibacterium lacusdiani TaxID=2895283 RepID=UPI001F2EA1A4|nr:universal stress protein [Mycolicibacterium lacusdiani]
MGTVEKSQRVIVAAVDDSAASDWAVRWAADEAVRHGARLTLAHVVSPITFSTPDRRISDRVMRWQTRRGHRALAHALEIATDQIGSTPDVPIECEIGYGAIIPTLSTLVPDAWMIAVGSPPRMSWGGRRLGSVSAGLCRHAPCSVAVVHGDIPKESLERPVVVGIDGSQASTYAIGVAFEEASRRRVPLIAVHVWSDVGVFPALGMKWETRRDAGEKALGEFLAPWLEHHPDVVVTRRLFCDLPAHWLLMEARRAGLVVVGSRGRGGFESLTLGSVATAVATASDAPVIVARPPR